MRCRALCAAPKASHRPPPVRRRAADEACCGAGCASQRSLRPRRPAAGTQSILGRQVWELCPFVWRSFQHCSMLHAMLHANKKVRAALGGGAARARTRSGDGEGWGRDRIRVSFVSLSKLVPGADHREAVVAAVGRVSPSETHMFGSLCDWRLTKRYPVSAHGKTSGC